MDKLLISVLLLLCVAVYSFLDILISKKLFVIKNIIIGISASIMMFLIVCLSLFTIDKYTPMLTLAGCLLIGIIAVTAILHVKYNFKRIEYEIIKYNPVVLLVILIIASIFTAVKYDIWGMSQDEGVYQIAALLMTDGNTSMQYSLKEYDLLLNDDDRAMMKSAVTGQAMGAGFYTINNQTNRGTLKPEDAKSEIAAVFHGIPNTAAIMSLGGILFGYSGIMHIFTIAYLLGVALIFLTCDVNLKLSKPTTVICSLIFALSPLILWVSKESLTEIILVQFIAVFIFLLTDNDRKYNCLLWFPVTAFAFLHVSIYVVIPIFILVFALAYIQSAQKTFIISGIISAIAYFTGFLAMGYVAPQYTFDNYNPITRLINGQHNMDSVLPIALGGTIIAIAGLALLHKMLREKKVDILEKINLNKVLAILTCGLLLIILYRWWKLSALQPLEGDMWAYYKGQGFIKSFGHLSLVAFAAMTGFALFGIIIKSIIQRKNNSVIVLLLTVMFTYCILIMSAFLRPQIEYYMYYARYLAIYFPIIIILGAIHLENLKQNIKIAVAVMSAVFILPFAINMAIHKDMSAMSFNTIDTVMEQIKQLPKDSTVVIDSTRVGSTGLAHTLFYPVGYQNNVNVFYFPTYDALTDNSFAKGKDAYLLTTDQVERPDVTEILTVEDSFRRITGNRGEIQDYISAGKPQEYTIYLYKWPDENVNPIVGNNIVRRMPSKFDSSTFTSSGAQGHLVYGPYITLKSGEYTISMTLELLTSTSDNIGRIDVRSNANGVTYYQRDLTIDDFTNNIMTFDMPFDLVETTGGMEFRVFVNDGVILSAKSVELNLGNDGNLWISPEKEQELTTTPPEPLDYADGETNLLPFSNSKIDRESFSSTGIGGVLLFGPYITLDAGKYTAKITITIQDTEADIIGNMDVVTERGTLQLFNRELKRADFVENTMTFNMPFTLSSKTEDVEFRAFVSEGVIMKIESVYLHRGEIIQ